MEIVAKIRMLQKKRPNLKVVGIDYLQLLRSREKFENRNQEVTAISRTMKLIARETNVCMLILSQLSRAGSQRGRDKRPILTDLRESGSLEQDADVVLFIHRPELYDPKREDLRGLAELIVAKQRRGPTGIIETVFLNHITKFENKAADTQPEIEEKWRE
jgi:replicative DNA helicase